MYRYRIELNVKPEGGINRLIIQRFYRGVKPVKIINIYPSHAHAFMATVE